jgi:hypothetical protein
MVGMEGLRITDMGWRLHDVGYMVKARRYRLMSRAKDKLIGISWRGDSHMYDGRIVGWNGNGTAELGNVKRGRLGWFCWIDNQNDNGEDK